MTHTPSSLRPDGGSLQPEAERSAYIGRFAPSPTGSLHLGSLLAAVASYVDARSHGGSWLLRMEDLDTPRIVPGSADEILRTLERFALHWDGAVLWQSRRTDAYAAALARLTAAGRTFECSCSRKELSDHDVEGYPGTCRNGPARPGPTATRFRVDEQQEVTIHDRLQGEIGSRLAALGDVVVRRRDGRFAYQLAVVVDDAAQRVTDVVRGADLLASTPWQSELQRALGLPAPRYAHVPLVVEPDGSKLAKSRRSVALAGLDPGAQLTTVLQMLGFAVPLELSGVRPAALLDWAIPRWRLEGIRGAAALPAPNRLAL